MFESGIEQIGKDTVDGIARVAAKIKNESAEQRIKDGQLHRNEEPSHAYYLILMTYVDGKEELIRALELKYLLPTGEISNAITMRRLDNTIFVLPISQVKWFNYNIVAEEEKTE